MIDFSKILILGLGISGKSAAKSLREKNIKVYAYDDYIVDESQIPEELLHLGINFLFNFDEVLAKNFELVMKSPGIKPDNALIQKLKLHNSKIISDIELGYLLKGEEKLICVTGTNGKTTTTVLINEILNACSCTSDSVGNIGVGAVSEIINTDKDFLVVECSSFQLDDISKFKPDIAVITNISSDHLDYHKTTENYQRAKLNIIKNLQKDDYCILNWDDTISRKVKGTFNSIFVSAKVELETGVFYKDSKIYISRDGKTVEFLNTDDVHIRGLHNYYNIMQSIGVAEILNLDRDIVRKTMEEFQGVPHRLQFVKKVNGVSYYNDSKGTNSDSTIQAISAFDEPIIIFLGGYDKGENFHDLLKFAKNKVKAVLALGQTQDIILKEAKRQDYDNLYKIKNLKEGVNLAKSLAIPGDVVLLSPASASWGMFSNFENRGNEFIRLVNSLDLESD